MFPLSSVTVRVGRARTYSRLFSTTRALRSGSFLNLGGLGASREAQYLSRERGIPRTEFSSNTHLIRSSEVDPFAPAPGATPSLAAARAAQDTTRSNAIASQATSREDLVTQLQAAREEVAQTKRAMSRLQARGKGLETAVILVPILFSVMAFIGYQAYRDGEAELAEPWQRLYNLLGIRAQQPLLESHGSTQPHRDATVEEHVLAESGLTSSEARPRSPNGTRQPILSGIFWANSK